MTPINILPIPKPSYIFIGKILLFRVSALFGVSESFIRISALLIKVRKHLSYNSIHVYVLNSKFSY